MRERLGLRLEPRTDPRWAIGLGQRPEAVEKTGARRLRSFAIYTFDALGRWLCTCKRRARLRADVARFPPWT